VSKLVFPKASRPAVSIAVVTHGAERWVWRALGAILDHTEPPYEVIVVDNASPSGMVKRLRTDVENLRLVVNETNRGFGPANNQAAAIARAPLLAFLNSDALVHDGWLAFLRQRLDSAADIAAVAPRLLNLDGTLQEAGALLYGNGYTQFVGFGDDPTLPGYRFPREVDYASAACLLVRSTAFAEVGGFAAEYAPAYYEDVDLCLELRRRGYRTLYEPRALVTHVRGASGDLDLAKRLWLRNHPIFSARWETFLATRPEHTPENGNPRLQAAARDAPALGRILMVTRKFPGPAPAGDARAAELVTWLAGSYPRARRTLMSGTAAPGTGAQESVLELGWEIADAGTIAPRRFHYDAVILRGIESPHPLDPVLEKIRGDAPVLRDGGGESDRMTEAELVAALAAAGIPAENLAGTLALA
jgi:GT2 family glycosyltransferase